MKENWEPCLAIILREEGSNDDDPRDPGGRTSRGIIQREWNVYRQTHPNRPADVWQASSEDVATIYHDNYWNPYCDHIPAGADLVFFNTSVNSGRTQAVKELQRALGIGADGMMGMITFNALDAYHDIPGLIRNQCEQRRRFYKALKTYPTFGKGWMARTDRVERAALEMAANQPARITVSEYPQVDTKPSEPNVTVSAKADPTQGAKPTVSPETSGAITAGGGSITAFLGQIKDQLGPFADSLHIDWIKYVLLAVTIFGIVYTVYGLIKKNRTEQAIG